MPQQPSQLSDAELDALLKQMGSGLVPEKAEARERLLQCGTEVVPRLIKIIAQEGEKRQQRQALAALGCLAMVGLGVGFVWSLIYGGLIALLSDVGLMGLVGLWAIPILSVPERQQQAIRALAFFEDVHTVGNLIDALDYSTGGSYSYVRDALTKLLPRLQPEDVAVLTPARHEILYRQLKMAYAVKTADFQCAILEMLGRLGGRESLPVVAWLVISNAPTAKEQQVRHAAEKSLSQLMERVDFGGGEQIGKLIGHLPTFDIQPSYWDAGQYRNAQLTLAHGRSQSSSAWSQYIDARLALTRLLPKAQAETFAHLEAREREILCRQLNVEVEISGDTNLARLGPDLPLALLEAFARTEHIEALSAVRAVAHGEAPTALRQQIRTAARSCLHILEAAAERKKVGETLLRASQAPETASDILLRPAAGGAGTEPQQLLRASLHEPE